eukprot:6322276-Karenia_brevis.AAC.1
MNETVKSIYTKAAVFPTMCYPGQMGGSHPVLEPVFILVVSWSASVPAGLLFSPFFCRGLVPLPRFGPRSGGLVWP